MTPLEAMWHGVNLWLPGLGLAALAAGLARLLWWRRLRGVSWRRLALWPGLAAVAVSMAGGLWLGRDGLVATYAAMVVAVALTQWWTAFGGWRDRA